MRPSPLLSQPITTFADYFKLNVDVEVVLSHFGYSFRSQSAALPHTAQPIAWYDDLYERINASLPYISLNSEAARREFLIAPILLDLARYLHAKVKVEFPLDVSDQLKGTIDYLIQAEQDFLVIEAKNADLQRGFTQLAAELIALDRWSDANTPLLYGAVSIGNVWQFGIIDRLAKQVTQDLNLFRVPADLEDLLRILIAILTENTSNT